MLQFEQKFLVGIMKARHVATQGPGGQLPPNFCFTPKQISPTNAFDTTMYLAAKKKTKWRRHFNCIYHIFCLHPIIFQCSFRLRLGRYSGGLKISGA